MFHMSCSKYTENFFTSYSGKSIENNFSVKTGVERFNNEQYLAAMETDNSKSHCTVTIRKL